MYSGRDGSMEGAKDAEAGVEKGIEGKAVEI